MKGLITPLIGLVIGEPRYDFTLGPFLVGEILTALIQFVAVAAVVYFAVVVPTNRVTERFKREQAPSAPPEATREEALLTEIRDLLRARPTS